MKWKETLIGAAVTLLVSVAAGIVVWFLTAYQNSPSQSENLRYEIQTVATFNVGPNKLGFVLIKLLNAGAKAAKDVRFIATFANSVEIREKELTISTGQAGRFEESNLDRPNSVSILIPSLAPKEVFTASLLVGGSAPTFSPRVFVRSSDSIGVESALDDSNKGLKPYIITSITIVALIFQGLGLWFLKFLKERRWREPYEKNRNNTAFMFLQRKLLPEATSLLAKEIEEAGATNYELSNVALLKGLTGKREEAESYFFIADWFSQTDYSKALTAFNRAILAIDSKNFEEAKRNLGTAFDLAPRLVLNYCNLSKFIADGMEESDDLRRYLEEKGLKDKRGEGSSQSLIR